MPAKVRYSKVTDSKVVEVDEMLKKKKSKE